MDMNPAHFILLLAGMACVVTLLAIIFRFAKSDELRRGRHRLQKEREQTYREIAAYVAEGTISPSDAERMMRAMGDLTEADKVKFDVEAARMRS